MGEVEDHALWVSASFDEQVGMFVAWVDANGRLPAWDASGWTEKSRYRWIGTTRERHRQRRVTLEQAEQLERLPGWSWTNVRGPKPDGLRKPSGKSKSKSKAKPRVRGPYPPATVASDLVAFIAERGRRPSSTSTSDSEKRLALAVYRCRQLHSLGRLPADVVAVFESIDGWVWRLPPGLDRVVLDADGRRVPPQTTAWLERCAALVAFVGGRDRWPDWRSKDLAERSLAVWLQKARVDARDGRLDADRLAHIDRVLPGWADPKRRPPMDRVAMVVAWWSVHGEPGHRDGGSAEERRAGRFVAELRAQYRAGELTPTEIGTLERLDGWGWGRDDRWLVQFDRWAACHREMRQLSDDLAAWVQAQRERHRDGVLAADRTAILDAHPGWLWAERVRRAPQRANRSAAEWVAAVEAFVVEHGRLPLVSDGGEAGPVYAWLYRQRRLGSAADPLAVALIERLAIPALPGRRMQSLAESIRAVAAFVRANGRMPSPVEDAGLADWCRVQRRRFHDGQLSAATVVKVETIPGWSWAPLPTDGDPVSRPPTRSWPESLAAYEAFVAERGRHPSRDRSGAPPRVTAEEARLAVWLEVQRSALAAGRLGEVEATIAERLLADRRRQRRVRRTSG